MREVTIVSGYRKTTISKAAIRKSAEVAYGKTADKKKKNSPDKKQEKAD
jgi:hypothetical protein